MGVPMLLDGDVIGMLTVSRNQVDPFSDHAVDVLAAFAAQAALAVRAVISCGRWRAAPMSSGAR